MTGERDARNTGTIRDCIFLVHVNWTPFIKNIYSISHKNAKKKEIRNIKTFIIPIV